MAETKNNYTVIGNTLEEIRDSLNFALQSIADRLDQIEGIRGTSTISSDSLVFNGSLLDIGNTDGMKIGDSSAKLAFLGATPIVQQSKISDPSGGATVDAESRTAIAAIIDAIEGVGLTSDT